MIQKCSLCGAELLPDEQCRDRFDLCLAREFENPTIFGVVHHLTVPCYMLQHNAYSQNIWIEARKMVAQFVEEGINPTEMRKQNYAKVDNGHRTWSITKGPKLSEFETIVWTRTIADIRLDNPESYCADVELWARSILADTKQLMQKLTGEA